MADAPEWAGPTPHGFAPEASRDGSESVVAPRIQRFYDLLFYDTVGMPYTGRSLETTGIGGSETEIVTLAEAMAEAGYCVAVLNRTPLEDHVAGVTYLPLGSTDVSTLGARTLAVVRYSPIPAIPHMKLVVVALDMPGNSYAHQAYRLGGAADRGTLIALTQTHRAMFPADWRVTVIPPVMPRGVYGRPVRKPNPHRFIYASSAMKGLPETLEAWAMVKADPGFEKAQLFVTSPGYDVKEFLWADGAIIYEATPSVESV